MPEKKSDLKLSLEKKAEKIFIDTLKQKNNPKAELNVKLSLSSGRDTIKAGASLAPLKDAAERLLNDCIGQSKESFREEYGFGCDFLIQNAIISDSVKAKIIANVDLTKEEQRAVLKSRYGIEPRGWLGFADEPSEKNVVQLIERVSKSYEGITASMLYTIAIGEGLNLYIGAFKGKNAVDVDQVVDSFEYLGLDFAAKELKQNNIKKLLPIDFVEGENFVPPEKPYYRMEPWDKPEKWQIVYPVIFKNLESALIGFGAILKSRMDAFLNDRIAFGYSPPDDDERLFWTYYYFQSPAAGVKVLKKNGTLSYTNLEGQISKLAKERVVTWRFVKINKLFKD